MDTVPYQVYCLSFNNPTRKERMTRLFETVNINCIFSEGVNFEDKRIDKYPVCNGSKKILSCAYGHLDMITDFYNSDKEFGIFCEDDICIRKDISNILPKVCHDFKEKNLDVLLLGYLVTFKVEGISCIFNLLHNHEDDENTYNFYGFPDYVWGTQMYMLSRKQAKFFIDKYTEDLVDKTIIDNTMTPFSADWVFTKEGNRALISPIIAIEDNNTPYDQYGQQSFHRDCFNAHFDSNLFIV